MRLEVWVSTLLGCIPPVKIRSPAKKFTYNLLFRLNRSKTGLNLDKIEDDIEEDREGRSKDEMDEKFLIKTVPNCKNIFGSEIDQGLYVHS